MPALQDLKLGLRGRSPWNRKTMAKFLRVNDFLRTLPEAPEVCDYTAGILDWKMMGNGPDPELPQFPNGLGNCTCAAPGHMVQSWTGVSGQEVTIPTPAIVAAYKQFCGFNPNDPSTDQGGYISTVLDGFRDVGIGGFRIDTHAEVNMTQMRMQQALYTFGPLDLGVELPQTAAEQMDSGEPWTIVDFARSQEAQPNSWGPHSMIAVYYSRNWLDCVTWGQIVRVSWPWAMYYMTECHAAIAKCFTKSPEPVNELVNDLLEAGT